MWLGFLRFSHLFVFLPDTPKLNTVIFRKTGPPGNQVAHILCGMSSSIKFMKSKGYVVVGLCLGQRGLVWVQVL